MDYVKCLNKLNQSFLAGYFNYSAPYLQIDSPNR